MHKNGFEGRNNASALRKEEEEAPQLIKTGIN